MTITLAPSTQMLGTGGAIHRRGAHPFRAVPTLGVCIDGSGSHVSSSPTRAGRPAITPGSVAVVCGASGAGPGVMAETVSAYREHSGAKGVAKLDAKGGFGMPARPRQTAHVCEVIEFAEDSATRTHRLLLLSWQDDQDIDEQEFAVILDSASATVEHTTEGVTMAAEVDLTITAGLSLIHNGDSPRSRRLLGELNIVEVDFSRGSDPDGPDAPDAQAVAA